MDKILFRVYGVAGYGFTGDYQKSYDMYCRTVHYAKLHNISTGDYSMDCIKPDGSCQVLYSMFTGELKEYNPCKDCKYVELCYEQGNPYNDLKDF